MKLEFHGAARSVTGSRHVLEVNGKRILLDCGLFQGRRDESIKRNAQFGFTPREIDAVILSHAHIDHSGALPALVRNGYRGNIFATPPTADLCNVMLEDAAHIQEKDIELVNRREGLTGPRAKLPLYTTQDAERACHQFSRQTYHAPFPVVPGVTATFLEAGHILGSSMVQLEIMENGARRTLLFSGDLGRDCLPITKKPDAVDQADILILETTYGDREHEELGAVESQLEALVKRIIERRGKIIIPAFAVGRCQQITFMLNNLSNKGRIPPVPIYVDSPLALETTEIFRRHPECWNPEMVRELQEHKDSDPFGFRMLRYIRTPEESKKLNDNKEPGIIISASGMCESGRILHHLSHHLPDPRNLVLIVGYQAEGTLGRRLVDGATRVMIYGREIIREAEVVKMNALSAHAGKSELRKFYDGFHNRVRNLFLVHGEPVQSEAFASWARQNSSATVLVPSYGQNVEL